MISNSTTPQSIQIIGKNRAIITDIFIAWVDTVGIAATQPRRLIIGRFESVGGAMTEEVFSIPCFKPVDNTTIGALGDTMHIRLNTPIVIQGKTDNSMACTAWSENGTNVYASFIGYLEA